MPILNSHNYMVVKKIDVIIKVVFTSILFLNVLTQVLIMTNVIVIRYLHFGLLLLLQCLIFLIFVGYFILSMILNRIFELDISKKEFIFNFLVNLGLLILIFIPFYFGGYL